MEDGSISDMSFEDPLVKPNKNPIRKIKKNVYEENTKDIQKNKKKLYHQNSTDDDDFIKINKNIIIICLLILLLISIIFNIYKRKPSYDLY